MLGYYASDFRAKDKDLSAFGGGLHTGMAKRGGKPLHLNDMPLIRWTDEGEILVATFGEPTQGYVE